MKAEPDPTLVAILQLDTLAKFADSDNTKIVVPYESAGLLGAAQALRSVIGAVPADGAAAASPPLRPPNGPVAPAAPPARSG